ncbi:MAG: CPBP family glutamic-type intramembrane protease [Spirochaetota bacterium]
MLSVLKRLPSSITTLPAADAYPLLALITISAVLGILIVGRMSRFFIVRPVRDARIIIPLVLISFIFPAMFEELLFRALIMPAAGEASSHRWAWALLSTAVFVVYHPLNGRFLFRPGRTVFTDARFLTLSALLGAACSVLYLVSGSIWPSILVHWLFVSAWLLILGGYDRMYRGRQWNAPALDG